MKIYTPENGKLVEDDWVRPSIFLAGTIDMGNSIDWQTQTISALSDYDVNIFNPRRNDWDSSWEQRATNEQFRYQVEWELKHLRRADVVFINILPDSKSPITLLEMGLYIHKSIIVCPDQFYRSGNIQITAEFFDAPFFSDFESGIRHLKRRLDNVK